MKFLCVLCDEPMKLIETAPPDRGSLSLVYECPECAHRIAMLTNPYETQVVGSLGVKIGPAAAAGGDDLEGCPFADTVRAMRGDDEPAPSAGSSAFSPGALSAGAPRGGVPLPWAAVAEKRLENVPEFVRPMARTGIEQYARENGFDEVTDEVMDRARDFFGM